MNIGKYTIIHQVILLQYNTITEIIVNLFMHAVYRSLASPGLCEV